MEYVLTSNTVSHAIAEQIHEWIPTIDIARWRTSIRGGIIFETRPLNIFTELSQFDPNDRTVYPYVFIRSLGIISRNRERKGNVERYFYNYTFAITFYVDISPTDRMQVPRINEELDSFELKLTRVLRSVEIWDDEVQVFVTPPPQKSDGVLHFFISVPVYEDTMPPEYEKMENLEQNISTMQKMEVDI